jgi:hypothetical protein
MWLPGIDDGEDTIAFGDKPNTLVTLVVRKILGSSTFAVGRDAGQDHRAAKGAPATAGYASSRKKTSAEVHARWCRWES